MWTDLIGCTACMHGSLAAACAETCEILTKECAAGAVTEVYFNVNYSALYIEE